jgi:RNA polymerase sigma factor (sigma-70 family)
MVYYCYQYEHTHHLIEVNSSSYARLYFQSGIFVSFFRFLKKVSQKFGSFAILTVIVAKGEQRSHHPKGGENVKSNSHEQDKRHAFDSFCKKILKHEARDYYDELKRQRNREVSFSELSAKEMDQLYTEDKYFVTEQIFNVLGLDVIVTDDVIAGALESLPERKRDIILLSYFLELSDREIGDKLNMLRSTVQYQRTSTLRQLKNFMEGDIYEQEDKK